MDLSATLVFLDVVGLALGLALIAWFAMAQPRPVFELCVWGAFGLVLVFAALRLADGLPHTGFARLRLLVHACSCVWLPSIGLQGILILLRRSDAAVSGKRRLHVWFAVLAILTFIVGEGLYLYAKRVEPFRLEVTQHTLTTARLSGLGEPKTVKVAVVADLQTDHIGDYEREVFATLDAERPDLILFAGDYIQTGSKDVLERERSALAAVIDGLQHPPRLGIFAVEGDVDFMTPQGEIAALMGSKARVLNNALEVVIPGVLQVAGLTLAGSRQPMPPWLDQAIDEFAGFTVIVGHAPDFALPWAEHGSDRPLLYVAGHCHGGQVQIPGFGPPITLSKMPRHLVTGFHELGDGWLHVSRGVGMERGAAPRIRLFCRPELSMITLRGDGD